MKKIKFLFLAAAIISIGSAFTSTSSMKQKEAASIIYHYTSNSAQLSAMKDINNWVAEDPSCGTTGDIPCAIDYNGDRAAFETYLSGFSDVPSLTATAFKKKSS